jgi:hypothetical protein
MSDDISISSSSPGKNFLRDKLLCPMGLKPEFLAIIRVGAIGLDNDGRGSSGTGREVCTAGMIVGGGIISMLAFCANGWVRSPR